MDEAVVRASGLAKRYGSKAALDGVDLSIAPGRIVGLIGPNGAGKTTALKAIMGLLSFDGELQVLGLDPRRHRHELMQRLCFIADVAVLPGWIRVRQLLELVEAVHPHFRRERALEFLARTEISQRSRVRELSKGMVTQLHLALTMAVDARLLVLDEPTIGLDILYRRSFYEQLLNDYFDEQRTIIVTTHQVEEIERILTDAVFIDRGRIVLNMPMEELPERFIELSARADAVEAARALGPVNERQALGRHVFLFDGAPRESVMALGETRVPALTDLFVATVQGVTR